MDHGIVESLFRNLTSSLEGHRACQICVTSPDHDIQRMGPPTGQESDGIIINPVSPRWIATAHRVRLHGGWTDPHFVIQLRRHRSQFSGPTCSTIRGNHLDPFQFADFPAANQFAAKSAVGHAPLLGSILEYTAGFAENLAAQQVLLHCQSERFLDVSVFAGLGRHDCDGHVPVIRSGNDHRIDILAGQQFAKVSVGLSFNHFRHRLATVAIGVGNRYGLRARTGHETSKQIPSTSSHSDVSDRHPFTGRCGSFKPQGRRLDA